MPLREHVTVNSARLRNNAPGTSIILLVCIALLLCVIVAGCTTGVTPTPQATTTPSQPATRIGTAHVLTVSPYTDAAGRQVLGQGATSDVYVTVEPGQGRVYVNTVPMVGFMSQESAKNASIVAARLANVDPNQYDFHFTNYNIAPGVMQTDGPSAGAVYTVAAYSALTKKPTNATVYETGTISTDGTIGPVGGIYWKGQAAGAAGAKILLVPPTQSVVNTDPLQRNTLAGTPLEPALRQMGYDVRVVEVSNINEVLPYYFS